MLRSAIEDYLDSVREREIDLPVLHILPLLGFYDIHFVHGPVEFGKDIIAKKLEADGEIQYTLQSKAGNITQGTWRNEIRGQIETALWSSLSHPNFNKQLPHQVILLTTGELRHNAAIEFQEFNDKIRERYRFRPVIFWDKRNLTDMFLEHGLEGVYRASSRGIVEYDRFLLLYVRARQAVITPIEIEAHSRYWGGLEIDFLRRLLIVTLEVEILAQICRKHHLFYEAAQLNLARLRTLCEAVYVDGNQGLEEHWVWAREALHSVCGAHVVHVHRLWSVERNMVKTWFGDLYMTTYPVQCHRILELAALAYFTAPAGERRFYSDVIADLVANEEGCSRPVGDRYAVSLVLATLVLLDVTKTELASSLLEDVAVWLCDRYEYGHGLAGIESSEEAETDIMMGYPFDFIPVPKRYQSLLATALIDLAAFAGDSDLYADIVNDITAVDIVPEYWLPKDTIGACRVEGDDVLSYPSVNFEIELTDDGLSYGEHLDEEPNSFQFVERYGAVAAVAIMALLRDRYFPKVWHRLVPASDNMSQ